MAAPTARLLPAAMPLSLPATTGASLTPKYWGQGHVQGFEVVEPEGHEQGCEDHAPKGGDEPGQADPDSEDDHGERGQPVLADNEQDIDDQQGQEAGDLAHGLDQAVLQAVEPGLFDREVADQGAPALQPHGPGDGQDKQKDIHPPVVGRIWAADRIRRLGHYCLLDFNEI